MDVPVKQKTSTGWVWICSCGATGNPFASFETNELEAAAHLYTHNTGQRRPAGQRGPGRPRKERQLRPCAACQTPTANKMYCSRKCAGVVKRTEHDHGSEEIVTRWKNGETLEQIGQSFGITRERVRQIIQRVDPHAAANKKVAARLAGLQKKIEKEKSLRKECPLCGGIFYKRPNQRYCEMCAPHYNKFRIFVEPYRHEYHRLSLVMSALRHPERARLFNKSKEVTLERAQELYEYWKQHGHLPPPGRSHYVYSKLGLEFKERVGPKRWQEIIDNFDAYYADENRVVTHCDLDRVSYPWGKPTRRKSKS